MNKKKQVLQIISRLDSGGAEKVFVDICNMLNRHGYDVTILYTRSPGELSKLLNKNIDQISLNRNSRFNFLVIFKFINIVKNHRTVHIHLRNTFFFSKIIMSLIPNRSWNIVFHDHFGTIDVDKKVPLLFKILKKDYKYVGVSETLCNWARENLSGINGVFNLPNIRLIEEPIHYNVSKNKYKKENTLKMIQVSNIHPIKNIEHSIKIISEIKKNINVHLTIYGFKANTQYYNNLIRLIKSLELDNHIDFMHDEMDIPSVLPNYHFGLYTSRSESGPLVLIEYLSRGLPFLSFNTGEVVKQLKNDFPQFIINNFNVNEWVECIFTLINKDYDAKTMVQFYHDNFSETKYLKSLINIYEHKL